MWGFMRNVSFSLITNGRPKGKFWASRGLREGDPLSLFLFLMVVDVMSKIISRCVGESDILIVGLFFVRLLMFFRVFQLNLEKCLCISSML